MKIRTVLVAGLAAGIGYVLGTAAGRARFEQIRGKANDFLGSPQVQDTVSNLSDTVKQNAAKLPDPVAGLVNAAADKARESAGGQSAAVSDLPGTAPAGDPLESSFSADSPDSSFSADSPEASFADDSPESFADDSLETPFTSEPETPFASDLPETTSESDPLASSLSEPEAPLTSEFAEPATADLTDDDDPSDPATPPTTTPPTSSQ